jgi:hypothetical protein
MNKELATQKSYSTTEILKFETEIRKLKDAQERHQANLRESADQIGELKV